VPAESTAGAAAVTFAPDQTRFRPFTAENCRSGAVIWFHALPSELSKAKLS